MIKNSMFCLLWFFIIIFSWCSITETSINKIDDDVSTWDIFLTWALETMPENLSTGNETYNNYPQVLSLDKTKFWQNRQADKWFTINDKNWQWVYYTDRNWLLLGNMWVQSADIMYGYIDGSLYIDLGISIVKFQVDEKNYVSYYPQLKNPNYTGTGSLQVQDKRNNYQICKDGYSMEQEEVVYDRNRYDALVVKNPMRCFWEDNVYIYGRREYKKAWGSWYELMRIKK